MDDRQSGLSEVLDSSEGEAIRVIGGRQQPEDSSAPIPDAADRLTLRTGAYVAAVALAAGACIWLLAPSASTDGWQGLVTLIILSVVFERVGVKIYGDTQVSAGVVGLLATGIIFGASAVAIAAPIVVLVATISTRSRWHQRIFDMSSYTLANVSAALVFHTMIDGGASVDGWWVPAAVIAMGVNYGVNIPLVGAAVSLSSGERFMSVWREEHQWLLPYYAVFALLGLALAAAYIALGIPGILAFVAPPAMMRVALHQYVNKTEQTVLELRQKNAQLEAANSDISQMAHQLTETYNGTLEALVLALDARDRETKGHSLRVASFVMAIARQLAVKEGSQDWVDMQRGALLHDVGKIGVPDYILHKPGPLTPEEWDEMKRHPGTGYDMLRDISFLSGAAAIVKAHHERYDGKGYPRGLKSDEIPLGARIFIAGDTFDAMTSDRPYRKALPPEVARWEILRHSGTQFDPEVVQAFLLVFDELVELARQGHEEEHAQAA